MKTLIFRKPEEEESVLYIAYIERISKCEGQKESTYYVADGSKVCSVKSGPFLVSKIVINEVV